MLQMFISGVMIDMGAIRRTGAKSILVAFSGLLISLALGAAAFFFVRQRVELDESLFTGIRVLIVFNSLTFFMVTSSFLHDLRITNSEVGRLAASASLVIDIFGLLTSTFGLIWLNPRDDGPPKWISSISICMFYITLFCVFRPLILFIVRKTPDGSPMKQTHFLLILAIVMFTWHWGERVGQRFSAFLFGLSLPHGPPLGSALVQKLQLFTSGILLPLFCTMAGWRMNLFSWKGFSAAWCVEIIFISSQFGKFLGTVISSMAVGVSLEEAVPVGLIMTFKGVMEIATFGVWMDQTVLDDRLYALAMFNIVIFTGVAYPLVQWLYDPSDKYNTIRKRKVMELSDQGADLQVLVCIHNEESIPAIFNLLEVSKYNKSGGSISVFALQVVQLSGSAIPILAPLHEYYKTSSKSLGLFDHVIKAFEQFEKESQGYARVQQFVSVTPNKSVHDDICSLAHDKRTSLIIIPFHKKWGIDGNIEFSDQQLRSINRRVLRKSPCSVGILIDRGAADQSTGGISLYRSSKSGPQTYMIVMLFIGGTDDYEALALARRMAEHPSVRLTVIWLRVEGYEPEVVQDVQEDLRVMRDLHIKAKGHDRISVRETVVEDGIGTTKALLSVQNAADLFVVGRYHEPDCPATQGLSAWSDSPEIGALADTLVSSDSRFSILVVQQQPRVDWKINSRQSRMDDDLVSISIDDSPKSVSIRSRFSLSK
ncbi:hypothetical protein BVRB_7g175460 [Beta vulgaris subsp. vulgaris]|nr:hypothetical protein BVRB_7g175460 [Beta vulgaris subsp. vulgaris]